METYLGEGILGRPRRTGIYLERSTPLNPRRRGVMLSIDIDAYDWAPEARPLIRATEGTVRERLPPRMGIRRGAPLEIPHALLLIDDEEDTLLPRLGEGAKRAPPLYDTPLMMDSGRVTGWALDREEDWAALARGLEGLAERARTRYGAPPFLYAVGDGNHSLAAAKAVWEEYKAEHAGEEGLERHSARWALVEVENLYDPGIRFEPIHRILFGAAIGDILKSLSALPGFSSRPAGNREELSRLVGDGEAAKTRYGLISGPELILVESGAPGLATAALQPLLDGLPRDHAGNPCSIDYIHGEEELFRLAGSGTVGMLLPPVKKNGLFQTVAAGGPLPRKSFSMGEAVEKRFYLECRRLFG
jgi:hypothetical protein